MFKKLMKHLANNLGLKLLSILLALGLWLVVVNVADPDKTKTFSVQVEIKNKDIIEEMGKVPGIVNDTDIASFYITGPRSYVEEMDPDDFYVTADLSQIDLTRDDDVKLVPIEIIPKKNEKYITVHKKTVNLQVTLEELLQQKFIISPEATGTPATGYAIGSVEVTPNLLTISGPETIVSQISKVSAVINVDGVYGDVSDNVIPVLYDEDGNEVKSDMLEMNQTAVTIRANILGTKNIEVRCGVTGTPAEGYEYVGMECVPETVLVKGEANALNGVSYLEIPEDIINIEGATMDVDETIDISKYLPEGVSLVDDSGNQIAVKALIEQKQLRSVALPVNSIKVDGLRNDYEIIYSSGTVSVTVRALGEKMENFDISMLKATLDVKDLEPGTHTRNLEIVIDDEAYEIIGTTPVQFTVRDKNAEEVPDTPEGENQTGGTGAGNSTPGTGTGDTGNSDADSDGSGND